MKYTREINGKQEVFEGTVEEINKLVMLLSDELLLLGNSGESINLGEGIDVSTKDDIVRGTIEI